MATSEIRALIALLDGESGVEAEEAQASLETYEGSEVFAPLMEAAPGFGRLGQLCAIELFDQIGDPRAGRVLIPMLRSEHDTVREWAAGALGSLGVRAAVPELRLAYDAVRARGTPLDWTEPEAIRSALTALGARREVVPPRVAELAFSEESFDRCWAVKDLPEVIDALAAARQLVLYFMYWQHSDGTHYYETTPGWELDWSLPWDALVETSRRDALEAARAAGKPWRTVARVSWMDETDR